MKEQVVQECVRRFGEPVVLVRAPGRVNLIGEHTDYNEGFVLPVAVHRELWVAARPHTGTRSRLYSLTLEQEAEFDLAALEPDQIVPWARYVAGVAWALQQGSGQRLSGLEAVIGANLPIGAGLSSSAALETAFALLWSHLNGLELDRLSLARLCQQAENEFVGVRCGLMDQAAALLSRSDHALFLDTRTLETRLVPIPREFALVIADTGKPRELSDSAYNQRRLECEEATVRLAHMGERPEMVRALRDVTPELLLLYGSLLSEELYRRARHVVGENRRVLLFLEALERGDRAQIGLLMAASHASLRDDYEVSCPELEAMVAACQAAPGCIGVRLTGAGFGGACIALVERPHQEAFVQTAEGAYRTQSPYEPKFYVCRPANGASVNWV